MTANHKPKCGAAAEWTADKARLAFASLADGVEISLSWTKEISHLDHQPASRRWIRNERRRSVAARFQRSAGSPAAEWSFLATIRVSPTLSTKKHWLLPDCPMWRPKRVHRSDCVGMRNCRPASSAPPWSLFTCHAAGAMSGVQEIPREIRELPVGMTHLAHHAMRQLRTAFESEQEFVERVDSVLRPGGYRLVGAFLSNDAPAVAIAGFRISDSLAWGHHLYVDDLSAAPEARRRGHAGALLDWLVKEGRGRGCSQLHLDSGTNSERFDAHRLYHRHGLSIYAHHFALGL